MKILVIQKKLMGDVLVSTIIFEALRKKYPHAQLHYLIDKKHKQIIYHHPMIDKIIYFDDLLLTAINVRKEKYNIIIDPYSKLETAIISLFSGAPKRISFGKIYTSLFYTDKINRDGEHRVQYPRLTTALEHRLNLLKPLGIELEEIFPKIYISKDEENKAYALLNKFGIKEENLIMISTFGSTKEKTYPIKYMAKIIDFIVKKLMPKYFAISYPLKKKIF